MAKQFTMTLGADLQGNPANIVEGDLVAPTAADEITIAIGDTVGIHRCVEINNGWKFLWNGVRDRGLLNTQFVGAVLLTGVDIDDMGEANRRTSSTPADFGDNDEIGRAHV